MVLDHRHWELLPYHHHHYRLGRDDHLNLKTTGPLCSLSLVVAAVVATSTATTVAAVKTTPISVTIVLLVSMKIKYRIRRPLKNGPPAAMIQTPTMGEKVIVTTVHLNQKNKTH